MIIYGTKTLKTVVKTGEFNCPNCQCKRNFTLYGYKKYFHLFFIPLFQIDNLGDGLVCTQCLSTYVPGAVLPKVEHNAESLLINNSAISHVIMNKAAFRTRLAAYLIDMILIYMLMSILTSGKFVMLFSLFGFVYFLGCDILLKGSSVGKLIVKIKVSKSESDAQPSIIYLIIRNLTKWMCSFFPFIYLVAISNNNVQTLHDMLAKTIVIKK